MYSKCVEPECLSRSRSNILISVPLLVVGHRVSLHQNNPTARASVYISQVLLHFASSSYISRVLLHSAISSNVPTFNARLSPGFTFSSRKSINLLVLLSTSLSSSARHHPYNPTLRVQHPHHAVHSEGWCLLYNYIVFVRSIAIPFVYCVLHQLRRFSSRLSDRHSFWMRMQWVFDFEPPACTC